MSDLERDDVRVEEEAVYITLEFDNGEKEECCVLDIFEVNGKEYIALLPTANDDNPYLYGYREIGEDGFELLDIEDDDEFEAVIEEFERLMDEEEEE